MLRFASTNNYATDPTVGRLERVPEDALRLNFMQAGFLDRPIQPFEQTYPFTILSQTLVGSQVVRFADVEVSAAPGEIFVVPNNQPMRIEHHPDRAGRWAARWVHIHFTLFGTLDFVGFLQLPSKVVGEVAVLLGKIIEVLLDPQLLQEQAFPYGFARRKELGFELLRILCEIAPPRKDALDFLHHSERLLPIFTFVDEHMHESISVADLADLINLSLSRFHVFFKAQMGESPMEYIKRVRLERSRQMLATTDVPVYAVAESVGFINPFHFSRAFKEASGMSPSYYRKQLQEEQAVVSP